MLPSISSVVDCKKKLPSLSYNIIQPLSYTSSMSSLLLSPTEYCYNNDYNNDDDDNNDDQKSQISNGEFNQPQQQPQQHQQYEQQLQYYQYSQQYDEQNQLKYVQPLSPVSLLPLSPLSSPSSTSSVTIQPQNLILLQPSSPQKHQYAYQPQPQPHQQHHQQQQQQQQQKQKQANLPILTLNKLNIQKTNNISKIKQKSSINFDITPPLGILKAPILPHTTTAIVNTSTITTTTAAAATATATATEPAQNTTLTPSIANNPTLINSTKTTNPLEISSVSSVISRNTMYDQTKPDLVIHPKFYKLALMNTDLYDHFNVLSIDDLKMDFSIKPILVTDKNSRFLSNVELEPYFKYHIPNNYASAKPENTSFYFERKIPIYTIEQNGPRYVIWTKDDPLTICATFVNRIDITELYQACQRAILWAEPIESTKSIIVFDLDDTLIKYRTLQPFRYAHKLLQYARATYDLVALYSHGSNLHVDDNIQKFLNWKEDINDCNDAGIYFDVVLSNNQMDRRSVKNLLSLYTYFPRTRFIKPTLVDDSLYNWSPEYTKFIVPSINETLYHALRHIS